ncbi:MAG TPA: SMC-Scp complex subunit ScpB [Alphaproteobacteria bacterium]|nr:SMC-Scp complex subunit ScpB [Paracoccaceae bacterium]RCL79184.1 MAG: SMC-Scp complex subunit ScpB [SAR116 cluster bacterium]HBQ22668.1 SMC-Scp complex subunit ScpB [Alphaproteobacteria bacterium]HCJ62526.1 SMC-Scp complex subunit ScpB [Alphaproteobacteria bacterium]HCY47087.1 SMC-Scp complex subunit ScpB [Alphaproteobacteria bacterium]|tara:strand:+ start:441 stop:1079 length:639 start_codon:yes stop_codon:yes gene_type:complete
MTEHDDVIDNTINFDDGRNQRLREAARVVEALLFASSEPLHQQDLAKHLDDKIAVMDVLEMVRRDYAARGVMLEQKGAFFAFRTAPDLGFLLRREKEVVRKFSKAALETLAIIAYHQPVTRTEIEEVRGVAMSRGTLDVLLEAGFVKSGRRRDTPGRPLTYVTTTSFLDHFGLERISDLPGVKELKEAGLLDSLLDGPEAQSELALSQKDTE